MYFKVSLSILKSAIQLNCMMIIRTILQNGPSASWTELLWFDLTFIASLCGESWISQILKSVNPHLKPQLYTSAACCTSSRCTDSCLVNWHRFGWADAGRNLLVSSRHRNSLHVVLLHQSTGTSASLSFCSSTLCWSALLNCHPELLLADSWQPSCTSHLMWRTILTAAAARKDIRIPFQSIKK